MPHAQPRLRTGWAARLVSFPTSSTFPFAVEGEAILAFTTHVLAAIGPCTETQLKITQLKNRPIQKHWRHTLPLHVDTLGKHRS
jgi:hypothetical protein